MTGAVTIANAPRDAEKLQIIGPFMLKRLMEEASKKLGLEFNEERKGAFLRDPIDKRAQDVLDLLVQIDKSGGAPAAVPTPTPTPTPTVETKTEKPKRDPRPSANGASNGSTNGHNEDGLAVLAGIATVIKGVSESIDAMQKTILTMEKGTARIDTLEAMIVQTQKLQHLTLAVLAQVAENQLKAPFADILGAALDEYEPHEKVVSKLVSGK